MPWRQVEDDLKPVTGIVSSEELTVTGDISSEEMNVVGSVSSEEELNVSGDVSSEEIIVTGVAEESKRESISAFVGQQIRGPRGYSAYEVAVLDGFLGSEEEWLISISTTGVEVSKEPLNRMEKKVDGLYVSDTLKPDPLSYYLLARS